MELKIADYNDIDAILTFHNKYYVDTLYEVEFSFDEVSQLIDQEGLFLVKEGEEVVAYVMAASWNFWSRWETFSYLIDELEGLTYNDEPLTLHNAYFYGAISIEVSLRGTGVFEKIFNFSLQIMRRRYETLVTFINKENARALAAHHRKIGLEPIHEFSHKGHEYEVFAYDTSKEIGGKGLIAVIDSPIEYLPYETFFDSDSLDEIYDNMHQHYYWSDDFSAEYYVAQAKAGFIAVSMEREGRLYLTPEIQKEYAVLDFKDLHISKKVKKLLSVNDLQIEIGYEFDELLLKIQEYHTFCWFNETYVETLKEVNRLNENCDVVTVVLRDQGEMIAGEVGYIIGKTYTSLTGFSSREKAYRNYGTAQLVLLVQALEKAGFDFMNLGQPFMPYKLKLGAKVYSREAFLERWLDSTLKE